MKMYFELEDEQLAQIVTETKQYLRRHRSLLESKFFWNQIDTKDFLLESTTLIDYCLTKNLIIREVAMLVVQNRYTVPLHIDHGPLVAKIDFPIQNCLGTRTEWYNMSEQQLAECNNHKNQFGVEQKSLASIDVSRLTLLDSIEMKVPTVFNSTVPHRVVCDDSAKFPRVVLSCMFQREPTQYLED